VPAQRGMTRRHGIAVVAGTSSFFSQPLIVELKEFNVRMFMTRGVGRSAGEGRQRQRRTPKGRARTRNAALESAAF
jgi:hypothetical protein